jgi:hypothetical protein
MIIIYGGKIWGKKAQKKKKKNTTLNTDQFSVCDLISKVLPHQHFCKVLRDLWWWSAGGQWKCCLLMGGLKINTRAKKILLVSSKNWMTSIQNH